MLTIISLLIALTITVGGSPVHASEQRVRKAGSGKAHNVCPKEKDTLRVWARNRGLVEVEWRTHPKV